MIYLKSVLAGLATVLGIVFFLLLALVIGMVGYNVLDPPAVGTHPWDPISALYRQPAVWLAAAVIFCAASLWRYRTLARWRPRCAHRAVLSRDLAPEERPNLPSL